MSDDPYSGVDLEVFPQSDTLQEV